MTKDKSPYTFWSETMSPFKDVKFPWGNNEFFMSSYRRNLELMNATQQITAETMKTIMQLQTEYMKSVFDQFSAQAKQCFSANSPEEKTFQQTAAAKDTIDQAIDHAREINAIIAKSNDKIIENIQKNAKKNVEESVSFAKKSSGK